MGSENISSENNYPEYHKNSMAAVLCIGTEITDGEILNKNAKWLSEKLSEFHLRVQLHLAIPDERNLIFNAIDWALQSAHFVFITGGLGPTSDDFTREVVSDFFKKPLFFDQEVYNHLEEKFQKKGRRLIEGHKNQCYFPEGSHLLKNPVGTADGFWFSTDSSSNDQKYIFVLPGPPREIDGIWDPYLIQVLKGFHFPQRFVLIKWKLEGLPESEIAERTEKIFENLGCTLGYRASKPNVYVKLWVPVEKQDLLKTPIETFEREFAFAIVEGA